MRYDPSVRALKTLARRGPAGRAGAGDDRDAGDPALDALGPGRAIAVDVRHEHPPPGYLPLLAGRPGAGAGEHAPRPADRGSTTTTGSTCTSSSTRTARGPVGLGRRLVGAGAGGGRIEHHRAMAVRGDRGPGAGRDRLARLAGPGAQHDRLHDDPRRRRLASAPMAGRLVPRRVRRHDGRAAPRPRDGRRAGYLGPGQPQDDRALRGGAGRGASSIAWRGWTNSPGRPTLDPLRSPIDHDRRSLLSALPWPGDVSRSSGRWRWSASPCCWPPRWRWGCGRCGGGAFGRDGCAQLKAQAAERRRAERALLQTEVFYHSLVETLPQMILCKDLEGRFTFANRKFCAELGTTLEAIKGKTDFDFFPRELAEKYRADDRQVIESRPGGRRRRAARHAQGGEALRPDDEDAAVRPRRRADRHPGHLLGRDRADARRGAAQGAERHAPGAGAAPNTRPTRRSRPRRAGWCRPRSSPAWVSSSPAWPTRSTTRWRS